MSVPEYCDKFAQLSWYVLTEVARDSGKQRRFLKGLYDRLQLQLMSNKYASFQELVDRAIVTDNKRKEMDLNPTNGTKSSTPRGTRTSSVLSTHSSSATRISSAPSNIKLATRHHVRECPTMPQSRVAPQATTPMHAITVERLINILTSAQRSRTSRPCRTSRAIRGPTLDLYSPARWIMCHLNQLRRRLRLWWVRLASTPSPLSYFSIPVSRILSYHKLLLECIAYPYVPWNISC
jgi:hypothetical protein